MDPVTMGVLAGTGVLGLGALFGKGKEGGMEKISTLSPEQQAIMGKLGPFISGRIGEGLPAWSGDWMAPLSQFEEMGLGKLGEYLKGGIGETAEAGIGAFQEGLKGMSPEATHDWYMQYIAPSEKRYLEREIIPGIKESHVGPGTLHGTPSDRGITSAYEQFGAGQLSRIGQAIQSERAGARSLIPYTGAMAALEGGLPQIEAAAKYGALPRQLKQMELEKQFAEFQRTTPELSPILDLARDILGITTQAASYRPYQPSPFMEMFQAVAPSIGAMAAGGGRGVPGGGTNMASSLSINPSIGYEDWWAAQPGIA